MAAIKAGQRDQNEEEQQFETLSITEEPRSTSFLSTENYRSAHRAPHNISILDERKSYRDLRKLLDNN